MPLGIKRRITFEALMKKPRYPANPDAPKFTPELWIAPDTKTEARPKGLSMAANCYQYALGGTAADGSNVIYNEAIPEPGGTRGRILKNVNLTKELMVTMTELDKVKVVSHDPDKLPPNKPGFYVTGIYVKNLRTKANPFGEQDYHYVRQDSDGGWSGKEGYSSRKLVERYAEPAEDGGYITLPKLYGTRKEYSFVGYGYVPRGGIDAGIEAYLIPHMLAAKAIGEDMCKGPKAYFDILFKDTSTTAQDRLLNHLPLISLSMQKYNIPEVVEAYDSCLEKFNQDIINKRPKPLTPTPNWP